MYKKIYILVIILFLAGIQSASAFWVWTPETNQWVNPKYSVKQTPEEQLTFLKSFFDKQDYKRAIEECNKLIKYYPKAREAAEAQYYIGLSQENQQLLHPAFKSYQVVIEKYPFSDRGPEIIKRQYDIGTRLMEGQGGKSNKLLTMVVGGDFDVIDVFRTVIKNAPYGEYAAPSQYKIGLYLHEKLLYQEARDEFEKVINDYPESEWAKAAKYQIALSDAKRSGNAQYDQAVTQTAVAEFKKFVENYPDAELSDKAEKHIKDLREKEAENNFVVAQFYEKQKNFKAAKIYYNVVVQDFKNTSLAQKALEKVQELNSKVK
jgi:outer membrane protein assembly factor BamD